MFSSLVATVISAGYPREKLEFIRHYAVFNIVSCELHLEGRKGKRGNMEGGREGERGREKERERQRKRERERQRQRD